jgi:hypothetical protein
MNSDINKPIDKSAYEGIKRVDVMKEDFGIDIPIESVPLPSKGIIYDPSSSLYNKETLDIRPMTAREEDILMSRVLIKNGSVLTELIKSCLVDKSIDPDAMISGDRNAILTSLRITGYGADYEVSVDCPKCSFTNKKTFNLSELKLKRLEIDPVEPGQNLFEVSLPVTKKTLRVKFLTGHDEKEMTITSERRKKQGFKQSSTITDRLIKSIVSIESIKDRNKISLFVKNMPARDSLALRKFLDLHEPGVDMSSWITCDSCLEESEVIIPMGTSFFWPET